MFAANAAKWNDCPQPPNDTPSDVQWSWGGAQSHPLLAASSWDGSIRVWQVQTQQPLNDKPSANAIGYGAQSTEPTPVIVDIQSKTAFNNNTPVLSLAFVQDTIFSGNTNNKVLMHNLATGQTQQVGQHEKPVCKVFYNPKKNCLCALSWDNTIRWWDTRSPTPAAQFTAPSPVMSGDMTSDILAVVCEDRNLYIYDLNSNSTTHGAALPAKTLQYGPKGCKIIPDGTGLVVSSYEGRGRVMHFAPQKQANDYTFRCHRTSSTTNAPITDPTPTPSTTLVHAVNVVDMNPIYSTLVTAGSDGYFRFWDIFTKKPMQMSPCANSPISCGKFDVSGRLFAFGTGYDWAQGVNGATKLFKGSMPVKNNVCVCPLADTWIKRK